MMLQALISSCKFMQINVTKWPTGQGLKAFMLWTSKMLHKKRKCKWITQSQPGNADLKLLLSQMFTVDVIQPSQHISEKVITSFELWKLRLKEVIDCQRDTPCAGKQQIHFVSSECEFLKANLTFFTSIYIHNTQWNELSTIECVLIYLINTCLMEHCCHHVPGK